MFAMSISDFTFTLAAILVGLGLATFLAGTVIIIIKVFGSDVHTIASQTTKLAQKGVAEDVAGLVGNAAALLDSLNQFVKTTAGLGIFLIFVGMALFAAAFAILKQIP
jgi:hypothetical protein